MLPDPGPRESEINKLLKDSYVNNTQTHLKELSVYVFFR